MLKAGIMLQERYEIIELIGSGGMADVYKAICHKLDRYVAIKVLKEEFCSDESFVDRFKMEAQSAAKLSHPNIVNVYDVVDEIRLHYIVMEYVEGITLKNYIQQKGQLGERETIGIALQVALGIQSAHENQIIHRDIKPQNVLLTKDGKVKVADFGIARMSTMQTLSSNAVGSVHYISPEQARGDYSDARSDIYSLGITMYEMITGSVPFKGENTVVVALAHIENSIPNPSDYHPGISELLESMILKCTEKKPGYRYSGMFQLILDLRKAMAGLDGVEVGVRKIDDTHDQTIMLGSREMEQIKQGKLNAQMQSVPVPALEEQHSEPEEADDDNENNSYLDMLFTGAKIFVTILIIALLFYVFTKITGSFQSGPGKESNETSSSAAISTEDEIESTEQNSTETTLSSKEVYMPDLSNLTEEKAEQLLEEHDLVMKVTTMQSDTVLKGMVISQREPVGSIVARYSDVHVVVSEGNPRIKVMDLLPDGVSADTAKGILESKNIYARLIEENHDSIAERQIIRVEPEEVKEGETVTVYVSAGPAAVLVTVPDLQGKSQAEAQTALEAVGLISGEVTAKHSNTVAVNMVIDCEASGTAVEAGSSINYVVSSGPEEETRRYVGSIDETYNLSNLIGPGSRGTSVTIMIRLKQHVNGQDIYTTKMQPTEITADTLLPVNFKVIEGAPGVDRGEIEVVEVESGAILKSYGVKFFPLE